MEGNGAQSDADLVMTQHLEQKRKYEEKRDTLILEPSKTKYKITESQGKYGTIYSRRVLALNMPNEVICHVIIITAT